MFAIVLFDTWSKNLVLARDPEGEKPLYFHLSDDQKHLIFSSDLTGLIESDMVSQGVKPARDLGSTNFSLDP